MVKVEINFIIYQWVIISYIFTKCKTKNSIVRTAFTPHTLLQYSQQVEVIGSYSLGADYHIFRGFSVE